MSKEITLPSGATVTLRDPRTLKQKDRAKLYENADSSSSLNAGITIMTKLIALLIEEWSFELVLPSGKIESLGELDIPDYDVLNDEAEKALPILWPKLAATTETESDPKAPTAS